MPLLDHFQPPLSQTHPWRAFFGGWVAALARTLNTGVLPADYYAIPCWDRHAPVAADLAMTENAEVEQEEAALQLAEPWQPPRPELVVAVDWPIVDNIRVDIFRRDGDPVLAGVIELISPRSKHRSQARSALVSNCADFLRRGCGIILVDIVTTRWVDFHAELLVSLGAAMVMGEIDSISAVSYRAVGREQMGQLQAWPAALELGQTLPTLPLWLNGEVAVPIDLEETYLNTCEDLRIREAG